MSVWIKDPLAVFGEGCERGLVVDGAEISECVPKGREPASTYDEVYDASRHVLLPGLINVHHHFYQTLTRSFGPALDKELFAWLRTLYPVWAGLNPNNFRLATRLTLAEMLLSGCTTSSDHHYVFPSGLEHAIDIQVEEAAGMGVRIVVTRGSMNLSVSDGGLPPDSVVQRHDEIMADSARLIATYHQAGPGAKVQVALAPCSPFSVTTDLMRDTSALAEQANCRLHTHLAETEDENRFCLRKFGIRPLEYLDRCGWLNDRVWLAHGIHFTSEEIGALGHHRVGISHCASSNMLLSSGLCQVVELEQAGCPLGLGLDGSASHDHSNMMQEVRQAFLLSRLRSGMAVSHNDALRWATEGSARCLGRTDIGCLKASYQADLAMFKLDELRFSGHGDPLAALITCGAHKADRVMVAGRWQVVDGQLPNMDLARLQHEHHAAARELQAA